MSVAARKALVPSSVIARVLAALTRRERLWPIIRQIGEVCLRHRLRTAMRVSCAGANDRHEKNDSQQSPHRGPLIKSAKRRVASELQECKSRSAYFVPGRSTRGHSNAGYVGHLPSVAAITAAFLVALACNPARAAPEINTAAPALVATTLDGRTFDLARLRGKVVLVNYWATWCAPCRKEMPKLDAFYKRYHDRGLEIISISIDFDRDLDKARRMAQGVSYPTALAKSIDDNGFGIPKGVPITWIIDRDGKVRDRMIEVRDELLNGIVVPLLPN
jgi:cytochrome c biogenesis protein CcmG, thiol:disulfide interchange protein DsbE